MEKFGKSQSVERFEDDRFLTGKGRYVADIAPKDALVAYVLRSPYAHARILELNCDDARQMDGVQLILTHTDLVAAGLAKGMVTTQLTNKTGDQSAAPYRGFLARNKLRHVGEAIAFVVADTLDQAKDAAEAIELDVEDLPVHMALAAGGEPLFEDAPDNLVFDWGRGDEAKVEKVLGACAHMVTATVADTRIIANSMEPRGAWAETVDGRLHLCVSGQGVWAQKSQLCKLLNVAPENVRVTNPDVGGGFGMKAMTYPENFLVSHAAMVLERSVKWASDRSEAMMSDNAGRDLVTEVTLGFDADFKLQAYKTDTIANMGAYSSQYAQPIQTELFSKVLTGVYDIANAYMSVKGVFTNTTPVDAYRGAGRPEAIYALESAMDVAARELKIDPVELRRRNLITIKDFPYTTPMDVTYDVGDFGRVLDRALAESDWENFDDRVRSSVDAGCLRGRGMCFYIESILGNPSETSRVVFLENGTVEIHVGTQSNGQGHETVFAQYLADQTGIPVQNIAVVQGDSDKIPKGGGTGGSRSATVQNTATLAVVQSVIARFTAFLADMENVDVDQIEFDDDVFRSSLSNKTWTMLEAANEARQAGEFELLDVSQHITLKDYSFPYGVHVAEVEVDPDTGVSNVVKYTVTDDFGVLLNPMLVEGQVHGGIAQGLGQVMQEAVHYDDDGQLLAATFMDYAIPRAGDMPAIKFTSELVPSINNPIGMKGCGEAGTIGSMAAVANAMRNALAGAGVTKAEMPFTPHRVWQMLQR